MTRLCVSEVWIGFIEKEAYTFWKIGGKKDTEIVVADAWQS